MTSIHEIDCPARLDEHATCAGCPYGVRLSAWLDEARRRSLMHCPHCGALHAQPTGEPSRCGPCTRALIEPDMGETRIVDVRLVRLRSGSWHVSVDGELVGESSGISAALDMVRDWFLEARR